MFLMGFACGALCTAVVAFVLHRTRTAIPAPPPVELVVGDTRSVEDLARDIGGELGNLASSVEGHAQLLCETVEVPEDRTDRLKTAVRGLRHFSDKLLAITHEARSDPPATDVAKVLRAVSTDLQNDSEGRQFEMRVTGALPFARVDRSALRNAVLFLADAVLDLEPDAAVLSLRASPNFDDEDDPHILIELQAEQGDTDLKRPRGIDTTNLSFLAAKKLLANAGVWLHHWAGHRANACVALRAVQAEDEWAATPDEPADAHPFGGVLILATDASMRSMLHQEMSQGGRHVVPCTDYGAAETLYHATPERFEFLVLDSDARRDTVDSLARAALELQSGVRVLVLRHHHQPPMAPTPDCQGRFQELYKPFGVTELRDSLMRLGRTEWPAAAS